MRRAPATVGVACLLMLAACDRSQPPLPSPSPFDIGTPVEEAVSPTPTVDPEATSGLTLGSATVTLTGVVNVTESYAALGLPAVWALPPEDFSITWDGAGERTLSLSGVSFTAQQPTAAERVLTFTVRGPDGPIAFRSETGECLLTISPALPDRMGGTFLCSALPGQGDDGTVVTVVAQGSFSAE